jgi:quercetin dioxygenase-like cupin family protein
MEIIRGRAATDVASEIKSSTFTGTVYGDPVLATTVEGNTVNSVTFTPGARTYWHHHSQGQLLLVTAGLGLVCPAGEEAQPVRAGDLVWVPPGERHWHGATPTTIMTHLAISIGRTEWSDEVDQADYLAAFGGAR